MHAKGSKLPIPSRLIASTESPHLDSMSIEDQIAENPIVDCDVLIASKENIQPLQRGRNAATLSAVLSTPFARRDAYLTAERANCRQQINAALEDFNPERALQLYSDFVHWTIEHYPQGQNVESGIIELLEEATRVLKERALEIYQQDTTYLQLWILYSTYVERPSIVFAFLLANEIGTDHSILYETYADELERMGRRKEADEIFNLGIARKSQPLPRLESRYRNFQRRMMLFNAGVTEPPEETLPEPVATNTRRTILGSTHIEALPLRNADNHEPSAPSSTRQNGNKLSVYADDGDSLSATRYDGWSELGTKAQRIKENRPKAVKAHGATPLKNKNVRKDAAVKIVPYQDSDTPQSTSDGLDGITMGGIHPQPPIVPFCDEEAEQVNDSSNGTHNLKDHKHQLRSKWSNSISESELLRKEPLRKHGNGGANIKG